MSLHEVHSVAIVLLVSQLVYSNTIPFSRSNKDLVYSNINASRSPNNDSGLLCGIACGRNCQDEYLIQARDQGELSSISEHHDHPTKLRLQPELTSTVRRLDHATVQRDGRRVQCDDHSMMTCLQASRGKLVICCSRLANHLSKGNKRGFQLVKHRLNRMSRPRAGNKPKPDDALKGRIERKETAVRQEEMDESFMCGESFYLDGIECVNADCSTLKLLCVQVLVDVDLADDLFCDLLSPNRSTLLRSPARYQGGVGSDSVLKGRGSPFGGLSLVFGDIMSLVLVGVHVLSDPEWQSGWFQPGQGVSCPDGMFLSELRYTEGVVASSLSVERISIECSRLERNLDISAPRRSAGYHLEGSLFRDSVCEDGFVTGFQYRNNSHDFVLDCRSLQCR